MQANAFFTYAKSLRSHVHPDIFKVQPAAHGTGEVITSSSFEDVIIHIENFTKGNVHLVIGHQVGKAVVEDLLKLFLLRR